MHRGILGEAAGLYRELPKISYVMLIVLLLAWCTGCMSPLPDSTAIESSMGLPLNAAPFDEPSPAVIHSAQDNTEYETFKEVVRLIPERLAPDGFRLFNHFPGNALYYGFDPELAWNKRTMTVVDGDHSKPSQAEFIYLEEQLGVVVIVTPMFVPTYMEPDIIGFISMSFQEEYEERGGASEGVTSIDPPRMHTEIFGYAHLIMVLTAFPQSPETEITDLEIINAKKKLGLELRRILDEMNFEG